jgi:D-lactate dehydrogenase
MKIAFFSTKNYDRKYFSRNFSTVHEITYFETRLSVDTVQLCEGHDAICVFVNDVLNHAVIEHLHGYGLRLILLRCAGFNQVDLIASKKFEMKVYRVPAYSPEAVAEHAIALIMTLNRKTHKAYNRIRELNFSLERLIGFDIRGKQVGVVGTGKIGAAFCRIMVGFGCKVVASDKYEQQMLKNLGVEYTGIDQCLSGSDIISLHCPLTQETKYMINAEAIGKMKDGVMLINTSRGGLINTRDVIAALKHEKIGYLGIDVYEQEEKLFFEDYSETILKDELIARLLTFPNVLITAHQGFLTHEALDQISKVTLENLNSYLENRSSDNEVVAGM